MRAWRWSGRTRASTRSSARCARRREGAAREPDDREHRDRARLDVGLPGGAGPLPEHALRPALRPLRRRDVPRLRRARARRVLREAARRAGAARDLAADPAGLPRRLRGARGVRADLLAARLLEALRDLRERRARRAGARRRQGASRRLAFGLARDRDAVARDPAPPRARDDRRGDRRARRAVPSRLRGGLHRRDPRVPAEGRADRAGRGARRLAPEREADPCHRGRRGRRGRARPRPAEGVDRVRAPLRGGDRGQGGAARRRRARRCGRVGGDALRARVARAAEGGDRVHGEPRRGRRRRTQARARSASSGSRTTDPRGATTGDSGGRRGEACLALRCGPVSNSRLLATFEAQRFGPCMRGRDSGSADSITRSTALTSSPSARGTGGAFSETY